MSLASILRAEIDAHVAIAEQMFDSLAPAIEAAGQLMINTLASGHKILLCGNGGSAADAQHIAAEFSGRFRRERRGLPAIALTTDSSALTSIANDYGFERVFARQVEAIAQSGDLVVGYSTSGRSPNILAAFEAARSFGCSTLGLTGGDGGSMPSCCDVCLVVPSSNTARIQEMHLLIGHTLCEMAEAAMVAMSSETLKTMPASPAAFPRAA